MTCFPISELARKRVLQQTDALVGLLILHMECCDECNDVDKCTTVQPMWDEYQESQSRLKMMGAINVQ